MLSNFWSVFEEPKKGSGKSSVTERCKEIGLMMVCFAIVLLPGLAWDFFIRSTRRLRKGA